MDFPNEQTADPLVSVIMPNRNGAVFLHAAIQSVQKQTWRNWELVIVDNGSTDNSKTIMDGYAQQDRRIKPVYLDVSARDPGMARNTSLERAGGRYIAFLDSDDVWYPEKLRLQIEFMRNKGISFCSTYTDIIDQQGAIIGHYRPAQTIATWQEMLAENIVSTSATIVDREKISGIHFPRLRYAQDYACWMKLLREGVEIHIMPQNLTQHRIKPDFYLMTKIPKAFYRWRVYREELGLGVIPSLWSLTRYTFKGFQKLQDYKQLAS